MSIEKLESTVARFAEDELARFSAWLEAFVSNQIDRQIEFDIETGKLDAEGRPGNAALNHFAMHLTGLSFSPVQASLPAFL